MKRYAEHCSNTRLSPPALAKLRVLVRQVGVRKIAKQLRTGEATVEILVGEGACRASTVAMIEGALAAGGG